MSTDGKLLYGIENTDSTNELVSYDVIDGKPTNRKMLDEDVESFKYIPEESQLYYYKEVHNGAGELYQISNGKSKRVSIDVARGYSTFYPNDGTLIYMTDYNDGDGTSTLHKYKNGESVKIASEVGAYYYNGSSDLYYLANYNNQQYYGDLMKVEDKGKSTLVSGNAYTMFQSLWGYEF